MAASDYTIEFVDGMSTGSVTLPVGNYTAKDIQIPGYETGSVQPFTITPTTTAIALSLSANGTLNITVQDDLGNNITAGTLQFSNAGKSEFYGSPVDIVDGAVSFANVPYEATTGISLHLVQDGSDGDHNPITDPQAVTMTETPQTEAVFNARKTQQPQFSMADVNYERITPVTGSLIING
jgi:hypothetical protein